MSFNTSQYTCIKLCSAVQLSYIYNLFGSLLCNHSIGAPCTLCLPLAKNFPFSFINSHPSGYGKTAIGTNDCCSPYMLNETSLSWWYVKRPFEKTSQLWLHWISHALLCSICNMEVQSSVFFSCRHIASSNSVAMTCFCLYCNNFMAERKKFFLVVSQPQKSSPVLRNSTPLPLFSQICSFNVPGL